MIGFVVIARCQSLSAINPPTVCHRLDRYNEMMCSGTYLEVAVRYIDDRCDAIFRTGNLAVIEMFGCPPSPAVGCRPHNELGGILYSTKICEVH